MSILCLICKDKLLGYAPGGLLGSLNNLTENSIIATACGHLYHAECLQSWFRTQQRKLQIQGISGFLENERLNTQICPSCQTAVMEYDNRRIYPLEDHREALDKARLLERQENLEIYCHQLEIQIQQLQRENDFLVNKILTPPSSPMDDYDTIVKNDRVVWMRKGDSPLSGIVLSIFKKEDKLCAKIKLDKKIRSNQRTNRILSSFRLDKKQEHTVLFDEIVLEKDFNNNNASLANRNLNGSFTAGGGIGNRSMSSTSIYQSYADTRSLGNLHHTNSTLSLPGDPRRLFGIQESLNEAESVIEVTTVLQPSPRFNRSISLSPNFQPIATETTSPESPTPLREVSSPQSITSSTISLDEQRDYVYITPSWMKNQSQQAKSKAFEVRSSPPDGKNKHVTFADDPAASSRAILEETNDESCPKGEIDDDESKTEQTTLPNYVNTKANEEEDHSVPGIPERPIVPKPRKKAPAPSQPPTIKPRRPISGTDPNEQYLSTNDPSQSKDNPNSSNGLAKQMPMFELSLYETITKTNIPISSQEKRQDSIDFSEILDLDRLQDFDHDPAPPESNNSCIDVTLLSLLYNSNSFDQAMLLDSIKDNEFCRSVKWIIRERFAYPLRKYGAVQTEYSNSLKQTISHLCSDSLDVEELLTILFEFTYKLPPFINYSLEMCDYLHQFFIDFTDKSKIQTVQALLEKSLLLQDNLKLEGRPHPALILQMPHSDDGVIHYEALIPNLTMSIDHLIEQGRTGRNKKCYCDNEATLECKICTKIHGDSAVLFCENCKELLQGIHEGNDHELQISSIEYMKISTKTVLALSAIICLKDGRYQTFLKQGNEVYSPWVYVHAISDGKVQMKELPGFGYWLESVMENNNNEQPPKVQNIPSLLRKVLKHSRVFVYLPISDSESEA